MRLTRPAFLLLLLSALLLSGCAGAISASSWPGATADAATAYLAYQTEVHAVRLQDHSQVWRYPEKGDARRPFYAPPVLSPDGKQLIVGDYEHTLYSLDPASGGPVAQSSWTFTQAKGRWIASPLVTEQVILAPNADGTLYALDLSGKQTWSFKTGDALWAQPLLEGDTAFLPSMDHKLYALNVKDGKQIWATDLDGAILGTPALSSDGVLYVGTLAKEVLAVSAQSGEILWRAGVSNSVWAAPVLHEDALYFGDMGGDFYAMNRADGKVLWTVKPDGPITSTALLTEGGLVFGTESGSLVMVDFNGKTTWNRTINGKLYSSPVLADGQILQPVTGADYMLAAFDLNGNQAWTFAPPKQ